MFRNKLQLFFVFSFAWLNLKNTKAENCDLMAYNLNLDLDYKHPEKAPIEKLHLFKPTHLSRDAMFEGLLMPKTSKFSKAKSIEASFISIDKAGKKGIYDTKTLTLTDWPNKNEYLVLKDFQPRSFVRSYNSRDSKKRLYEVSLHFKGQDKIDCTHIIRVFEAE